jgi:hypothetical protein
MKKFLMMLAVAGSVATISCKSSADKKMPELANDICNCMSMLEKDLSADAKKIITDAASASDPSTAMQKAMMDIPADKQMEIASEMMKMGEMQDQSKGVGACMKKLQDKYEDVKTMDSDKTILKKVIAALEEKKCNFAATIMKLGAKEMGK